LKFNILSIALLSAGLMSLPVASIAQTGSAPTAKASAVAPFTKVTSVEGLTEYRLANGLRVLLFPDASKATLTTNIVYMVGSRHENYGETGMAHLLEHLLFKPSANFGVKKGSKTPVEVLNAVGGEFNGTTWYDRTNYFSTFPANDDNLRLILAMEADRMVNAAIDQNDLWNPKTNKGEMTVVRNEFEMGESDPIGVTTERIQAVAFDWHNYGKSTIGARSDIEQVNIQRLRAFYKNFYQPDNAILIVAGRFDEAKVLKQVQEFFGKIPKPGRTIAPTYTAEPVQDGERSVVVRRSGGSQFVGAGYHVAPGGHADAVAVAALDRILVDAPSGRLHKALVETKLASRLQVESVSNLEPSYRIYGAVVPKDGNLDAAQDALLKVTESFASQPVTQAELDRAKQQLLKGVDLAMNDTARLTISLTEALAAGDWRLFFINRDRIEKLDLATVQAAATTYFKATNRTLGKFSPTDTVDRANVPATPNIAALVNDYKGRAVVAQGEVFDPSPDNIEKRTQRSVLPNGLKLALLPKKTKGETVSMALQLRFGSEESLRGKAQVGELAAQQLLMGTDKLSRQQIKDSFDKLKAQVSVSGGAEGVTATITTVRSNLPAALDLLAQVLSKPSFPANEFTEQQLAAIGRIEQALPEPQPQAVQAMRRLMDATPEGHVRHVLTFGEQLAALKAIRVEDVRAFHQAFYGAGNASFSAVGDFDAAALKSQVSALLGAWKAQQPYARVVRSIKAVNGQKITLETPDKANSVMLTVLPVPIKDSAPNYPALLLANHMIGGGALKSRLADRIRQKEGLSYGVGSQFSAPAQDPAGLWLAFTISAPQNTAKVEVALKEEMQKVLTEGFNAAELAEAKKAWRQGEEVGRTDDAMLARSLADYLGYERTMAFDKDIEAKVAALTLEQVNQAVKQVFTVDSLSVIAAGDFAGAAKAAK
jgi:zinc protease